MKPHPKVSAAAAAGAAVTVCLAAAAALGYTAPPELAGALVTLAAFAGGYMRTPA